MYKDIITVTGVCSDTYHKVLELQKKSCKDSYRFDYQYFTDEEWGKLGTGSAADSFWGYTSGLSVRVQLTIDRVKKYWGQLLLLTDADLVFFKETEEEIRQQLQDKDMLFLQERLDKNNLYERAPLNINLGFVLMRCNMRTLVFWEEIKRRVEQKSGWDQEEANLLLIEKKDIIKWGYFSDRFSNGGDVTEENIARQYICTSCGTIAQRHHLGKEDYLKQMLERAKKAQKGN